MPNIEKCYSFHSVIVPANHIVTIECFINECCTTRKLVILLCAIIYIFNTNISNVKRVVGDEKVTLQ